VIEANGTHVDEELAELEQSFTKSKVLNGWKPPYPISLAHAPRLG
jgi:hypothetical protein